MSRYLIERDFPEGLSIPQDEAGAEHCREVIGNNAEDGVTWLHSYVTPDRKRTFCDHRARRGVADASGAQPHHRPLP